MQNPDKETTLVKSPSVDTAEAPACHLPWIDWLRFLAAFAVLLVHARSAAFVEYSVLPPDQRNILTALGYLLSRLGSEAVLLFFVLSGFLVGGRLIDRLVDGDFRIGDYVLDRLTRIYLPLVPALLLTAVIAHLIGTPAGFGSFLANLFGLQLVVTDVFGGNTPLWSLSYEIWFYALGGSLAQLVHSKRVSLLPVIVFLASLVVFTALGSSLLFCWLIGAVAWRTRPVSISPWGGRWESC